MLIVLLIIVCGKKPMHLFGNLYSTGLLGSEMPEQFSLLGVVCVEPTHCSGDRAIEILSENFPSS